MKNEYILFALQIFTYYILEDASELETRLTTYLLTSFIDSKETSQYFLRDEIIFGHELFDDSGKRVKKYLGIGISESDLPKAIDQVNDRNIFQIKGKSSQTLIIKLNINYLQHAIKELS